MKISKYRQANIEKLQAKAFQLYKEGLTLREVGKIVGKSHEWVRRAVKKVGDNSPIDKV